MLDAVLRSGLGVDAQLGNGHELADERRMAHGAVMEMRQAPSGDDQRVFRIGQGAFRGLLEHANRRIVVAGRLLVGVHVRDAGTRQAQHSLAVYLNLARHGGKTARQAVGHDALVLLVHHVLVQWHFGIAFVDVG